MDLSNRVNLILAFVSWKMKMLRNQIAEGKATQRSEMTSYAYPYHGMTKEKELVLSPEPGIIL